MAGLLFGLGAAIAWGIADFLAGIASRRLPAAFVGLASQLVAIVCYGLAAWVAGVPAPTWALLAPGLIAGVVSAFSQLTFFQALALGRMGVVAPVAAAGAAVPVLVGIVAGETPGPIALGGIVLAGVGVSLACRREERDAGAHSSSDERRSIGWALASALLIGTFLVALDVGAAHSLAWTLIASRATGLTMLLPWAVRHPGRRGDIRAEWQLLAALGLLNALAVGLYSQGTRSGLLGIVAMSAGLHSVVTALLAAWLLRERLGRAQRTGVALATFAVVAMASGR